MDGWMGGWVGGWMGGCKSHFKDCLQQSKIVDFYIFKSKTKVEQIFKWQIF
jgi:hypothetical protein